MMRLYRAFFSAIYGLCGTLGLFIASYGLFMYVAGFFTADSHHPWMHDIVTTGSVIFWGAIVWIVGASLYTIFLGDRPWPWPK